jgi:Zn-dependent protease with chaperone function
VSARANPFCGPSDTTFRFVLLVVAAVAAGAFAWDALWLASNRDRYVSTLVACQNRVGADPRFDPTFGGLQDRDHAVQRCLGHLSREQALWSGLGAVGVIIVAVLVVAALPAWKIRRRRLQPVAEKLPAVVARVGAVAAEEGITHSPDVLWNRRSTGGDALAFGVPGHYRIALGPALVAQQYTDAPAFDAVIRHELAHIANRDVVLTYLANAIWYSWCVVALVPLTIGLAASEPSFLYPVGWRVAVMTALIYLTRNGLLRAREQYADVRASRRDGPDGAMARVLDAAPRRAADRRPALLRWHPSTTERLAIVRDPTPLLRLGVLDAFAAGLAGGIAIPTASNFVLHLTSGGTAVTTGTAAAVAVVGALLGAVFGAAVWRAGVAVRTSGPGGAVPVLVALALAAGVLVAHPLSLSAAAEVRFLPTTITEFGALAATLVAIVAVYLWAVDVADGFLDVRTPRRPLMATVMGATALALAWAVTLGVTFSDYASGLAQFTGLAGFLGFDADNWRSLSDLLLYRAKTTHLDWVVWAAVAGLPLAAVAWTRRRARPADPPPAWAYLELPAPGTRWRRLGGITVQPALVAGLVGGAAGTVVVLAGRLVYRGLAGDDANELWRRVRVGNALFWIGAGAVLVTAAVVAARSRRLPMAMAMLAGLVTTLVAAAGTVAASAVLGDHLDADYIGDLARPIIGLGLFAALLGASLGVGARAVAHAVRPARAEARAGPVGWIAVAVGAAVLLATVGTAVALAGGTAPVAFDYRDFALSDGFAIVTEVDELKREIQALSPVLVDQVEPLRSSIVPKFRALHDRAAAGLTQTRPVTELRERLAADLTTAADELESYASAVEHGDGPGTKRAVDGFSAALQRIEGAGTELVAHVG